MHEIVYILKLIAAGVLILIQTGLVLSMLGAAACSFSGFTYMRFCFVCWISRKMGWY